MECYILDQNYEIQGFIDAADSLYWHKRYNDIGECEIYIAYSNYYYNLLKKGYYVYRFDDDMFCKIEKSDVVTDKEKGDFVISTATDICKILSGRIIRWQIVYSGTVANFIKKILIDNVVNTKQPYRKMSNFRIDDSNFDELTDTIETTAFTEDLLQLIIKTCKVYNLGFRISFDINTKEYVFRIYKGKNKATTQSEIYVEFSPAFANIKSSSYTEDESNYKNLCYVSYKNSNDEVALLSVYNTQTEPQGEERKEIFVDGSGVSRDITEEELLQLFPTATKESNSYFITINSEKIEVAVIEGEGENEKIKTTDFTHLQLIRFLGMKTLENRKKIKKFSGDVDTINTYEYKIDYDLGDIVKVYNKYGITANAQITEIIENEQEVYSLEPKFEYFND